MIRLLKKQININFQIETNEMSTQFVHSSKEFVRKFDDL